MCSDKPTKSHTVRSSTREWAAHMISPNSDAGAGTRASFVSSEFEISPGDKPLLHISAQGLYRAFVNGRRVGNDCLTPGWTCYDDRIAYQTYDISDLVAQGLNQIEIWLGDGWFRSPLMWREHLVPNYWGEKIAAIAEIVDGSKVICATNAHWQSGLLPITKNGIYHGEDHDARLPLDTSAGVEVLDGATGRLVAHETGAVKEMPPIAAVKTWQTDEGTLFDFGQNVAGYPRITVEGKEGASVYIDVCEVLGPNGEFDRRNYRDARAALSYVLSGNGTETWAPMFTFMGYRYARVRIDSEAKLRSIHSVPITSVPEPAGGFECGVEAVNRLVLNTIWSQRSNFIEVPTDCPQRDERLGWTGDAQIFAGTSCWLADSDSFFRKYLRDVMFDQRPDGAIPHFSPDTTRRPVATVEGDWAGSTGWGDVITVMPWKLYLHYGNDAVLRECFPSMQRWLDYLWSISGGPIIRPHSVWGEKGFTFGDWLQPTGDSRKPRPTISDDCAATLYHCISTDLTSRIAHVIGETEVASQLAERASQIRSAIADEYFSANGRLAHNDQTSYALAFLYDLVPESHFEAAKGYFRRVIEDADFLIGTGFIGTPALLPALTKLKMNDLAEKVFLNRRVPGWLYQVERGATTVWERWDAIGEDGTIYDPMMNSYNHYAYGAVCEWLFTDVAGVRPVADAPGFDRVVLDPTILPGLGHVDMWHMCRHGLIKAGWQTTPDGTVFTVTLPEGCEATAAESLGGGIYGHGTHRFERDCCINWHHRSERPGWKISGGQPENLV